MFILHQRRQQSGFIQVNIGSDHQIQVFVNGKKSSYSGLPPAILPNEETIDRARGLLAGGEIIDHGPTVQFRTDLTRLRGGFPPFALGRHGAQLFANPYTFKEALRDIKAGNDVARRFVHQHSTVGDFAVHGLSFVFSRHPYLKGLSTGKNFLATFGIDQILTKLKNYWLGDENSIKTQLTYVTQNKQAGTSYSNLMSYFAPFLKQVDFTSEATQKSFMQSMIDLGNYIYENAPSFSEAENSLGLVGMLADAVLANASPASFLATKALSYGVNSIVKKGTAYVNSMMKYAGQLKQALTVTAISSTASAIFSAANLVVSIKGFKELKKLITQSFFDLEQRNQHRFKELCRLMAEYHSELMGTLLEKFSELHTDLKQLETFINAHFSDLQTHLYRVEMSMHSGFASSPLWHFKNMLSIASGGIPYDNQAEYQLFMRNQVMPWCTTHCYDPFITGAKLPADKPRDIVVSLRNRTLLDSLGYLAKLLPYDPIQLPEISVYCTAIETYLMMRTSYDNFDAIFARNPEATKQDIVTMMNIGNKVWEFAKHLQASDDVWNKHLFHDYLKAIAFFEKNVQTIAVTKDLTCYEEHFICLDALYLQIFLYIQMAFNVSFTEDDLLKLLLMPSKELNHRLLLGNELNESIKKMQADKISAGRIEYFLMSLFTELRLTITLLQEMIVQYRTEIKAGMQQCEMQITLTLIKLAAFSIEQMQYFADMPALEEAGASAPPDMTKFPLPKEEGFYLPDNIFHRIKVGDAQGVTRCITTSAQSIDQTNQLNETPLLYAAKHGDADLVKLILTLRPNIDWQDKYGNTAVMLAVENQHIDVVKLLVAAQAKCYLTNAFGDTPISVAKIYKDPTIAQILAASNTIHNAIKTGKFVVRHELKLSSRYSFDHYAMKMVPPYLAYFDVDTSNLKLLDIAKPDVAVRNFPAEGIELKRFRKGDSMRNTCKLYGEQFVYALRIHEGGGGSGANCMVIFKIIMIFVDLATGKQFITEFRSTSLSDTMVFDLWQKQDKIVYYEYLHHVYEKQGQSQQIHIVDIATSKLERSFYLPNDCDKSLQWLKVVDNLLLIHCRSPKGCQLEVHDLTSCRLIHTLPLGNHYYSDVEGTLDLQQNLFYGFNPVGDLIAFDFVKQAVAVTYTTKMTLSNDARPSLVIKPNGQQAVIIDGKRSQSCEVQIWDLQKNSCMSKVILNNSGANQPTLNRTILFNGEVIRLPSGLKTYKYYNPHTGEEYKVGDIDCRNLAGQWQNSMVSQPQGDGHTRVVKIWEIA